VREGGREGEKSFLSKALIKMHRTRKGGREGGMEGRKDVPLSNDLSDPPLFYEESEDGSIGRVNGKVGVVEGVT